MTSELTLPSSAFANTGVLDPLETTPSGFSFDHFHRNRMILDELQRLKTSTTHDSLATPTFRLPQATKTGTTICGAIFDQGVVLGADTRATSGDLVAEKNCNKIHYMAPNIYSCGAGTSADTEMTTQLLSSQLELLRMETHSDSRVVTAVTLLKRLLFRYQGHIGAALIVGGCDVTGAHLFQCHPHGSTSRLAYTSMGSGSLAAISVLETSWRDNMTETDAVTLVQRAIAAGIYNDSASGSNIDICIVRLDGTVTNHRNMVRANDVSQLRSLIHTSNRLTMRPGVTPVLKTDYLAHPVKNRATLADVTVTAMEVEDTS